MVLSLLSQGSRQMIFGIITDLLKFSIAGIMVQKVRRKVDKCFNQNINIFVRKAFE